MLRHLLVIVACSVLPQTAAAELLRPVGPELLGRLTPSEFGERPVPLSYDVPEVASRLAFGGGDYTVDRIALAIRSARNGVHVDATVVLHTDGTTRIAAMPLDVPHGARVTSLAVAIGNGWRSVAETLDAEDAIAQWRTIVHRAEDPALLAFEETRGSLDRLDLRAFPVSSRDRATIDFAIDIPLDARIPFELDPRNQSVGKLELSIDGARRVVTGWRAIERLELGPSTAAGATPLADTPGVAPGRSLFAAGGAPGPLVIVGRPQGGGTWSSPAPIRKIIRLHTPQLRRCYMAVAQGNPKLEGDLVLHFLITAAGKVDRLDLDGSLADEQVRDCVRREVSDFAFPATNGPTFVNYPLTFKLAAP